MKKVQLPEELFLNLCKYFLLDDITQLETCKNGIQDKLDKMCLHDTYSKYKNANLTAEEREQARQKYLNAKGIPNDYRW